MTDKDRTRKIEERRTSGEEIPPDPVLVRQGERHSAGADTPSGPFTDRTPEKAKRSRRKQDAINAKEGRKPAN
jgi:hypothetical protein